MIELLEVVAVQSPGFLILALATGTVASEDIACVAAGGGGTVCFCLSSCGFRMFVRRRFE